MLLVPMLPELLVELPVPGSQIAQNAVLFHLTIALPGAAVLITGGFKCIKQVKIHPVIGLPMKEQIRQLETQ